MSSWTAAFDEQGLAGLVSLHSGRAPARPVAKLEARVLNRTLKHLPRDGSTHWSSRKLAGELGDVSFSAVQRIWRKHGVRPHRLVFSSTQNTAACAGGFRCSPPLSPGRAQSHGFEYKRNSTLSLFAALNTATGEVLGKTAARHTSEQFVTFLEDIVASQPWHREKDPKPLKWKYARPNPAYHRRFF